MGISKHKIPLAQTNYFSKVVIDYVNQSPNLKPFVNDFPSANAIQAQIELKTKQVIDRKLLKATLEKQYGTLPLREAVLNNLNLLESETTFTICTAHQPNIFTGYLYFIYKIIHAIKLSTECKMHFPQYDFVPVYYVGSEDNDVDEIGTINFANKKVSWKTNQTGACGSMSTFDLISIRDEIIATLNPAIDAEASLIQWLQQAYDGQHTLTQATRMLVNAMFGHHGLLVLDGNDNTFKSQFKSVMKEELFLQESVDIVNESLIEFEQHYKGQATPRALNLFYLRDDLRERIEQMGAKWIVLNSAYHFTKDELEQELENYPERFSPNVILRPVYQETILPNIAFVGGGGELAYWLPLKPLFSHVDVPFPVLFLRNSILLIDAKSVAKMNKLGLTIPELFISTDEWIKDKLKEGDVMQMLQTHQQVIDESLHKINELSQTVSANLPKSMEAHRAKVKRIQYRMNQKFIAQLKQTQQVQLDQFNSLKSYLFPNNSLQERTENFFSLIKSFDVDLINILLEHEEGFGQEFIVLCQED